MQRIGVDAEEAKKRGDEESTGRQVKEGNPSRGPTSGKRGKVRCRVAERGVVLVMPHSPISMSPEPTLWMFRVHPTDGERDPLLKPACAFRKGYYFFTSADTCTEQFRYKYPVDPSGHTRLFGKSYIRTIFFPPPNPEGRTRFLLLADPRKKDQHYLARTCHEI